MKRAAVATTLLTAVVALTGVAGSAAARESRTCARGIPLERDPRGLLPLTGVNPIAPATAAAVRHVAPADKPQVRGAALATVDQERGPQAKRECGTRVWNRTVVVYVLARALLPSQSLSQRAFFVGRFADGYSVWQIVH